MSILEVEGLSMSFDDKQLYKDASFRLNKEDHMGIIGQNGAGKSTLIKILTGSRLPDEGRIKWQRGVRIGYLDQYAESAHDLTIGAFLQSAFKELFEVQERQTRYYEEYAEKIDDSLLEKAGRCQEILEANDFYGIQTKIDQVMSGLGIDALGSNRQVSECSGGQRSKIILAKLLLEKPDVLLLDEPTNYLDTEHIEWLIDYLNGFEGCFMVISHDYDFLERITNTIVDVAFGKITKYTGSFRKAIRQKEEKKAVQLKAYEKQRRQIEKDEAYIRKNKAGTRSTMAKSRQKRLDKLERIDPPSDNLQAHFKFPYIQRTFGRIRDAVAFSRDVFDESRAKSCSEGVQWCRQIHSDQVDSGNHSEFFRIRSLCRCLHRQLFRSESRMGRSDEDTAPNAAGHLSET